VGGRGDLVGVGGENRDCFVEMGVDDRKGKYEWHNLDTFPCP
jgi:hypothetical protein